MPKKAAKKRKWTAGELERRLRVKFPHPKYAIITGVANATGWSAGRWCDAITMGLWPSSGLHMSGYEIKVTRGDWLRELQDVSKSEAFAKYLDFWWIVAPPGIVKLEELPARWGLMETSGVGPLSSDEATGRTRGGDRGFQGGLGRRRDHPLGRR